MHSFYHWFWHLLPGNPLVVRIVQNASRRPRHLLVRSGYLGVLILLVVLGLLTGGGMQADATMNQLAKAGTLIFERVAYGQVILICLLSPLFMAGAIVAERSGRTYEILLTTPLSNLQIVLGSLVGRLFLVLALLCSGIPLFAVLLIFGGVPIASVFMSFATAALAALVVGAMAVTLATLRTGGRKAVFVFIITVASYLVFTYILDRLLLRRFAAVPGGTTWLTPLHPLLVLEASLNSANYRPPPPEALAGYPSWVAFHLSRPFAAFALFSLLVSATLTLWCAVRLRRIAQGEGRLWAMLRRRLRLNRSEAERRRPPREVWHNPIAWREASTRGKLAAGIIARWGFTILALLAAAILLGMYHRGSLPSVTDATGALLPPHVTFYYIVLALLLLEVAVITMVAIYMSAGCISREREDGTLDLLLTTPITPKAYIWGKLRGLVSFLALLLAAPVLTLLMISAYTAIGRGRQWPQARVSFSFGQITSQGDLLLPEAPLLLVLVLAPFVAMCVAVGMNASVKAKGVLGAVAPTVAIIGGLALTMGFCGWSLAKNVPLIGAIVNGFSPTTNLVMILNPWEHVSGFIESPTTGRWILLFCSLLVAGGYSLVVYALLLGIVSGFDQTVRRLTGTA